MLPYAIVSEVNWQGMWSRPNTGNVKIIDINDTEIGGFSTPQARLGLSLNCTWLVKFFIKVPASGGIPAPL